MHNRKKHYAMDKLKTVAMWPWVAYERMVEGFDSPCVDAADWWEETMINGGLCVAWVMGAIAALAVSIATCNCVFDHDVAQETQDCVVFQHVTNLKDERRSEYSAIVAAEAADRGIAEDQIAEWTRLDREIAAAEASYENSSTQEAELRWVSVERARSEMTSFLADKPKLEDVQYGVDSTLRLTGRFGNCQ